MPDDNKRGLAKAWANHPWSVAIGGALLSIPAGLIVVYLTREERSEPVRSLSTAEQMSDLVTETETPATQAGPEREEPAAPPPPDDATLPDAVPPSQAVTVEESPKRESSESAPVDRSERKPVASEAMAEASAPRLQQSGCPARQAALNFKLPGEMRAFISLSGVELVTLHNCEAGQFSTHFEREAGALEGLAGAWSAEEFRMQFGYRSDNGWGNIVCTVIAEAVRSRRYAGNISCNASGRRGATQTSALVSVGL